MRQKNTYLAIDLGASNGRVIAGYIEEEKIRLDEIYRFPNVPLKQDDHLYWNFPYLLEEIKKGLKIAGDKYTQIVSIGIDTWGVDFGLLDKQGNLQGNPHCYRDARTRGIPQKVFSIIDKQTHYRQTGIQSMEINTLFQLYSLKETYPDLLKAADKMLFMPDLFAYFLTGEISTEYCIASTSGLVDIHRKNWAHNLIRQLGFPKRLFGEIIPPSNVKGYLKDNIAKATRLHNTKVVTVASHDTASAVLAIPSPKKQTVFISSGTWSLIGATVEQPILSEKARTKGFTNEGGLNHIRFLRNTTGLWILQNLVAQWQDSDSPVTYPTLIKEAFDSEFRTIIDVDNVAFLHPQNMQQAIIDFCASKKMDAPTTHGDFVRCVLESLADKYKRVITDLQTLLPETISEIHIIGGGSQNRLLNQLTADKTGRPIVAGPVEATALGNLLVQAMANKELNSIADVKPMIKNSTEIHTFYPKK